IEVKPFQLSCFILNVVVFRSATLAGNISITAIPSKLWRIYSNWRKAINVPKDNKKLNLSKFPNETMWKVNKILKRIPNPKIKKRLFHVKIITLAFFFGGIVERGGKVK